MAESPARKRAKGDEKEKREGSGIVPEDEARTLRAEFSTDFDTHEVQVSEEPKMIDGFEWYFRLVKKNQGADLYVSPATDCGRFCYAQIRVQVSPTVYSFTLRHVMGKDDIGSLLHFHASDIVNVRDGKFSVEAHIEVLYSGMDRDTRDIDFSLPSPQSNVVLNVQGTKLHVCKQILANRSVVFERMFYGAFREATDKEIEIKDVSSEDFTEFIECIYNRHDGVSAQNVRNLLRLADRFDCPEIMDECETALIYEKTLFSDGYNAPPMTIEDKLAISEQWNLQFLMDYCVSEMHRRDGIKGFLQSAKAMNISEKLRRVLLCKLLHPIE